MSTEKDSPEKANKPAAKDQKPDDKTRTKPKPAPKSKKEGGIRPTGLVIVACFSVMAALAGGAIGAYAAKHFDAQNESGAITQTQLSSALNKAENARAELETELSDVKAENTRLRSDVSSLEARLFALEQKPELTQTAERALVESSTPNSPSRVTISDMVRKENTISAPDNADLPEDVSLPEVEKTETLTSVATIESLAEDSSAPDQTLPRDPAPDAEPAKLSRVDIIASFPKAKMMAAIETPKDEDVGFIRALWRKHVQSGNDAATRDRAAITAAEQALGRENISDAITALDKASPPVKAAAADWIADAQTYLNAP